MPILLDHLARPYPDRVRDGIARVFETRDAAFAWDDVRRFYEAEPAGTETKDGLAAALNVMCDPSRLEELLALARDPAHGDSRILLIDALRRYRQPAAKAALREFASDPVLGTEATAILSGRPRNR